MSTAIELPRAIRPPRRKRSEARRREARAGYLFLAPFAIVFLAMLIIPLIYSAYLSFYRKQLVGGTAFVGFANYVRALHDHEFLAGVGRMAEFLVIQVPIMLIASLVLALILDSGRLHLKRFVRLAVFVPYAVPAVIASLMWGYLYGRDFGPFAQLARFLGGTAPDFLSSGTMLFSIMNIVTWSYVGYNMIIMYSALRTIPTELYEAARIDGAGEFQIAWSIKIPALRPAIVLTVIFSVIGTFQLFNEPNILHTIAPNVITRGYTPNIYAYNQAFVAQDMNYAAAIAFLLGFVIMAVSYVFQLTTNRRGGER
jgi:multiple sugar transport system permease protein